MINKIIKEDFSSYTNNGIVRLYHFSKEYSEQLNLDPSKFGEKSWTKREFRTSDYPRTFFYLDLEDRELFFSDDYTLYYTEVDQSEIYDLKQDSNEYVKQIKERSDGALNFNELFKLIHEEENYSGVYYTTGSLDIVAWFEPITVHPVDSEKNKLEDGKYHPHIDSTQIIEIFGTKNVAIISSQRGDKTEQENIANHNTLKSMLERSPYNFTEAYGGYVETYEDDTEQEVEERSFMVWIHPKHTNKVEFLKEMLSMAKDFEQESILFKPFREKRASFAYTDGSKEDVGRFVPNKKTEYFTRVGDFYFVFE